MYIRKTTILLQILATPTVLSQGTKCVFFFFATRKLFLTNTHKIMTDLGSLLPFCFSLTLHGKYIIK